MPALAHTWSIVFRAKCLNLTVQVEATHILAIFLARGDESMAQRNWSVQDAKNRFTT